MFANIGRRVAIRRHSVVTLTIFAYTRAFDPQARPLEYFGHGNPPPGVPRSIGQ